MLNTAKYRCLLFLLGLTSLTASAQTNGDTTAKLMEAVVVTGQFAPQSLKSSVYKVRVINRERIRLRGATDIIGVLNSEAGIRFSTDFALGEADISLMGMNGQSVKILLDGVPLIDRGSTRQSLSQIDINTIDRIEIVEGPMSVAYGTDALAGVINIITKKPKTGVGSMSVTACVQEESAGDLYQPFVFDGVHNEHLGLSWSGSRWNASGYASRNSFGGYRDTLAAPQYAWKPKDQWLGGASLGYRSKAFSAWYRLDYLHEKITAYGSINLNNYKALDQYFITDRYTHQLQTDWQISNAVRMNSAVSYQDYKRRTETYSYNYANNVETATDPAQPGNEGQWDIVPFKNFFFRSTLQWLASPKLSVQPGVEIKTDHTGGQRIEGSPTITDYSLFASAEYKPVAAVTLRPGMRFSKNSVYDAPPVIPSLNARIALSKDWDLRLSYARGFRAPILRELYFLFRDGNHDIKGNTDLKAEYSNSYQGSVSWQAATGKDFRLTSVLSGFYNDFNDRIELAALPNSTVFTYINVAKYKTTGGTLENTVAYKRLSATVNVSYVGRYNVLSDDAAYKSDDLPSFTWSPEVSANVTYHFAKLGADAAVFYKYTGKLPSYQVDAASTGVYLAKLEGYHWADVTLSKSLFRYFTLQAGIKNLFDVTRLQSTLESTGSAHGGGGPILTGYGRSCFLGLSFGWNR